MLHALHCASVVCWCAEQWYWTEGEGEEGRRERRSRGMERGRTGVEFLTLFTGIAHSVALHVFDCSDSCQFVFR